MQKTIAQTDYLAFKQQLDEYKKNIDSELNIIAHNFIADTAEQFGDMPKEVVQAYCNILLSGGKRIRGALAMVAYGMFGGNDKKLVTQASCALEILNTYVLIADDIQDRSELRRGSKTAHIQLRDYHAKERLKGDEQHFGESMAINSLIIAQHHASGIIASLDAPAKVIIKALQNINKCFMVMAHGQTMDLFTEATGVASYKDVNNILEWKTAYYTFINPMQLGAILASASDDDLSKLADYGLCAGRAFQLTDDIIGIFGEEEQTGKGVLDDIKEGKRTLLVVKALENASRPDAYFLESCLGNQKLTKADFEQCKRIIKNSGSLQVAKEQAVLSVKKAESIITQPSTWPKIHRQFLIDLVNYLLIRKN